MPLSLSHYSLTVHSLEFTDINLEMTFLFTSICYPQRCFLGSVVDPGSPSLCGSVQTRTQPLFIGSASAPSFWNWSGSGCDSRLQTVVILMSLASNAYLSRTVKGRNWECMTPAPAKKNPALQLWIWYDHQKRRKIGGFCEIFLPGLHLLCCT